MLVMFRFKNFASFKDEVVFDMRAIKSYKEHPYNLIRKTNGDEYLKVVGIYGANASGKTNFVEAYNSFLNIVLNSFRLHNKEKTESVLEENFFPFLLAADPGDSETEFEGVYRYEDYEYKYGFIYNKNKIVYEWLYRKSVLTSRQSKIIERTADKIELGSSIKKTCDKYVDDIDNNVLALSFFSSLKLRTHLFDDVVSCVTDILPVSFATQGQTDFMIQRYFERDYSESEKKKLLLFLAAIDVGIKDIRVKRNKDKLTVETCHVAGDGIKYYFPLSIESAGTLRAIALYSFMRIAVLQDKGLIIDELNIQLHPLLQKYLIDLFYQDDSEGQLIYTTHDTTLLDRQYMRRDQIWFTDKNDDGESTLYSLAEFRIRNDKSIEKDYLAGIYGGIPILSDFSIKED